MKAGRIMGMLAVAVLIYILSVGPVLVIISIQGRNELKHERPKSFNRFYYPLTLIAEEVECAKILDHEIKE
jgi:hypothetical protein